MRISDWSSDVCSSDLRGADAAATEYRDARPGFDLRGAERRTDAGQDRAPDERGAIERNILVDLHHRPFGQEHELGETAKIGERDQLLAVRRQARSEEHTSELQSLMRISYAVFCLKKKKKQK